jgi:hypothetical protein
MTSASPDLAIANPWPSLPLAEWQETYRTLHMCAQIVGKIRLAHAPMTNHWWHTVFYVTARGLTTSPIPYGSRTFQIDFDFIDHEIVIHTNDGAVSGIALGSRPVADYYRNLMAALEALGLPTKIWTIPVEIENPIPFERDTTHHTYDGDQASRFWQLLAQTDRVFKAFRGRFVGKASPVHFFWGSFDLAVTRFSGRRAPPHPGAPNVGLSVAREAYSHEVSSAGFWPGGGPVPEAIFYSYAYPEPAGFAKARVQPHEAYYDSGLREFVLPYSAVCEATDPDAVLLAFLQSSYDAAADGAAWDRTALERL